MKRSEVRENIAPSLTDSGIHSTTRDTVVIAVFGALWGLMEITIGVTLKGLRIPMGGAMLTSLSAIIFLTGRYFVPRRGSILMMGAVAAILKIFSIGTVIAGPFLAILIEAGVGEVLVSLLGIHRVSFMITGSTLLLYTIIHPFLSQGIVFGTNIYRIYLETFTRIAQILHLDPHRLLLIVAIYAGVHALMGAVAGWVAFTLSRMVDEEFRRLKEAGGEA